MITDADTNFLYLSDRLMQRAGFVNEFLEILDRNEIAHSFLPKTNDIWAVDYMPVQRGSNHFIQFTYQPDYLQTKRYRATITDAISVCEDIGVVPTRSKIKLDGGNVIRGEEWVLLTDKIFKENPDFDRFKLIDELERLFGVEVIIVPKEPGDFTGHADGIVRYFNKDTVLINGYGSKSIYGKKLMRTLKGYGLNTFEITHAPTLNGNSDSADGYYINFLQMNDFILLPTFGIKDDEEAYELFSQLYPRISTIDAMEIAKDGGVLNCITWNVAI